MSAAIVNPIESVIDRLNHEAAQRQAAGRPIYRVAPRTYLVRDDGGRAAAGYKGSAGDCVTRAIAIATGLPYQQVYDELFRRAKANQARPRRKGARKAHPNASPRRGVSKCVYEAFLKELGFVWHPTCKIGDPERTHLLGDELPGGTIICRVSRHLVTVVDTVVHDTGDCTRAGTRMVYGYYQKGAAARAAIAAWREAPE